MMKIKRIGIGCILAGICLFGVPYGKEAYEEHCQQELLMQWQQKKQTEAAQMQYTSADGQPVSTTSAASAMLIEGESVVGVLKISAIDLIQPILKGATKEHLNVSASTIEPTGIPGAASNFAVAGHNSRTYGRHFNRLGELQIGDEITVECKNRDYVYEVADAYVVKEDEVWVLEDTQQTAEITLVTCFYPGNGDTERLVVKGTLK